MADRVGPALVEDALKGGAGLGRKQRVILPIFGLVDIEVGRDDVIIAARHDGRFQVEQRFEMRVETRHPLELVIIFGARPRVAIGQIETGDEDAADRRLDIAALFVARIAGKAAARFVEFADAAEHRDAVPAALAVPDDVVARVADRGFRKFLLRRLEFLEADDVGLREREPFEQHRQAAVDAVHIISRDLHRRLRKVIDQRAVSIGAMLCSHSCRTSPVR